MVVTLTVDFGVRRACEHITGSNCFGFIFYEYEIILKGLILFFCVEKLTNIGKLKKVMSRSFMERKLVIFI